MNRLSKDASFRGVIRAKRMDAEAQAKGFGGALDELTHLRHLKAMLDSLPDESAIVKGVGAWRVLIGDMTIKGSGLMVSDYELSDALKAALAEKKAD